MTRTICLYRVSINRQVDVRSKPNNLECDIPMQRNACHQYCQLKGWTIVKEFNAVAVSAYSTPRFGREAIQEILTMSQDGTFDILLVFSLDRLSRGDYGFPMLIEQLTSPGIEIWSINDGGCSFQTPTDQLMTYLAGWRASCESERIDQRVNDELERVSKFGKMHFRSFIRHFCVGKPRFTAGKPSVFRLELTAKASKLQIPHFRNTL